MREDKRYSKETLAALNKQIGEDWKKYGFDFLQNKLFAVMELENEDDLYVGTDVLVKILKYERNKIQRTEHQNLLARVKNSDGKNGG